MVLTVDEPYSIAPTIAVEKNLLSRSFYGFNVKPADDYLESRIPVLVNNDVHISLAAPRNSIVLIFLKTRGLMK